MPNRMSDSREYTGDKAYLKTDFSEHIEALADQASDLMEDDDLSERDAAKAAVEDSPWLATVDSQVAALKKSKHSEVGCSTLGTGWSPQSFETVIKTLAMEALWAEVAASI